MQIDIVKNLKRNLVFGVMNKLILMICPFVERSIIRHLLGAEYLGLSSLFNSILTVLSMTELGFGSAVVYHMYKPVSEGDTKTVNALLSFYRKAYRMIGLCILAIGLSCIPFLPQLIHGSTSVDIRLGVLYCAYLANVVMGYMTYGYMTSLIVVHQRDDIESSINSVIKLSLTACQIAALYLTRNYYIFAFLIPVFALIGNLWTARVVRVQFPMYHPEGDIPANMLSSIKKVVAGSFIQKACGATRNSLDSICTSAFLGLALTASYNNYYMISDSVTKLVKVFIAAVLGGVGNHVATKSKAENFSELEKFDFVYMVVAGWCLTCLLGLYQPFMNVWMGREMLLEDSSVFLFGLYFYLLKMGDIRAMYVSASGLWWEHRNRALVETLANLVLNIGLGKMFGVNGIISATIISMFLFNYLWGTRITIGHVFGDEYIPVYYRNQVRLTAVNAAVCALTLAACRLIPYDLGISAVAGRLLLCIFVPAASFFLIYRKNENFLYLVNRLIQKGRKH